MVDSETTHTNTTDVWVGKFADGTSVIVDNEGNWTVQGEEGADISALKDLYQACATHGWPSLNAWPGMNLSPEFDPYWMALRLYAIGAVQVVGRNYAAEDQENHNPDVVY